MLRPTGRYFVGRLRRALISRRVAQSLLLTGRLTNNWRAKATRFGEACETRRDVQSAASRLRRAGRPAQTAAPPGRSHHGPTRRGRRGARRAALSRQAAVTALLRPAGRRPGRDDRPPGGRTRPARERVDAAP